MVDPKNEAREWWEKRKDNFVTYACGFGGRETRVEYDIPAALTAYAASLRQQLDEARLMNKAAADDLDAKDATLTALTQERDALRTLSPMIVEMLEHYRRDAERDAPGRYRSGNVQECIDALQSFAAEEQPKP